MPTFETKQLAQGSATVNSSTPATLFTVPASKRAIITSLRANFTSGSTSATVFELRAGSLVLLYWSTSSTGDAIPTAEIKAGSTSTARGSIELLNDAAAKGAQNNTFNSFASGFNSLILEAGQTIQFLRISGTGSASVTFNISGIEVTLP